jgi:maltose O-acetyltransferase
MLAGEVYRASDSELAAERLRARKLAARFNGSDPEGGEERRTILEDLLDGYGEGALIEPPFHCDYGWNITIGEDVFLNFGCVVLDCAPVRIGAKTQIGPGVHIYAATHPTDPAQRADGRELARPVTIGRNVWLGGRAVIGPGVSIGDDSVIGAASVVLRDVPAGALAAGAPAQVLRTL